MEHSCESEKRRQFINEKEIFCGFVGFICLIVGNLNRIQKVMRKVSHQKIRTSKSKFYWIFPFITKKNCVIKNDVKSYHL